MGSLSIGGDGPSCADDDISEDGEGEPEVVSVAGNEIDCETVEDNPSSVSGISTEPPIMIPLSVSASAPALSFFWNSLAQLSSTAGTKGTEGLNWGL